MSKARTAKVLSCAECRRLKIKCDLAFPCAHCCKRGLASICPSGELKEGLKGQRVLAGTETLHKRILELEDALREATSPTHSALLRDSRYGRDNSGPASRFQEVSRRPDAGETHGVNEADEIAVDRLSSYSHLVVGDAPGQSRYYGAASSVYLTRRSNLRPQTVTEPASDAPPLLFDLPSPSMARPALDQPFNMASIMQNHLPSEEVARRLSDIYFNTFGWFTNIVPYPTFDRKYFAPFYHTSTTAGSQQLAVLFLVLALGIVMDSTDQIVKHEATRSYITAARLALALDPTHSVALVQICYLYVTYVMNSRKDTAGGEIGWPFLRAGMAIVEAIGLHRDPATWDLEEDEATERRIVFWEIHGYDVLQSIALGRGQCIADFSIDCAYPEDGDETAFHVNAYALTRIWSRINERQVRIAPSPYSDVIAIDRALTEYERSLPEHLGRGATSSLLDLTVPTRKRLAFQRNMLLMYLTEARIALHRGWFVRALREFPLEPLESPQQLSYLTCLESCRSLVGLVRSMLSLHDQQINRRWHFWFHLFSACACLAACVIRAPGGSLANAIMAELESGIGLFKLAARDETAHLEGLARKAQEALRVGRSRPEDESEELDLLSARKTLRRSGTATSGFSTSVSPQTQLGPQSVRESPAFHLPHPPTGLFDAAPTSPDTVNNPSIDYLESAAHEFQHDEGQHRVLHDQCLALPFLQTDDAYNMGAEQDFGTLGEFDMDAFLREMGLL